MYTDSDIEAILGAQALIGRCRARLPEPQDRDARDRRVAELCDLVDRGDEGSVVQLCEIERLGAQRR